MQHETCFHSPRLNINVYLRPPIKPSPLPYNTEGKTGLRVAFGSELQEAFKCWGKELSGTGRKPEQKRAAAQRAPPGRAPAAHAQACGSESRARRRWTSQLGIAGHFRRLRLPFLPPSLSVLPTLLPSRLPSSRKRQSLLTKI